MTSLLPFTVSGHSLSLTSWEQSFSDLRSQPTWQRGHQVIEFPTSSRAWLRKKRKKIRIPGSLFCPLMLAPLLPGEFREGKKRSSLAKPVCLFTANTFCSGLCSCFHSWKGNIFYLKYKEKKTGLFSVCSRELQEATQNWNALHHTSGTSPQLPGCHCELNYVGYNFLQDITHQR